MSQQIVSASALRAATHAGHPFTLSTGAVISVRRTALDRVMQEGIMPQELLAEALAGFSGLDALTSGDAGAVKDSLTKLAELKRALAVYLAAAIVAPAFSIDPTDDPDVFTIDDLLPEDAQAILLASQTPVRAWKPFLPEQAEGVPAVENVFSAGSEAV